MAPGDMPKYSSVTFRSWRQGMVSSVSPEDTPEDAGRDVMDILIERDNSLIRPPGIVQDEDVTPRSLKWMFEQASLDYSTELVVIDAPYLGYKSSGVFTFANAGIAAPGVLGWNAVNVLGVLVFSDGSAHTYARVGGAAVVIDISASIIARTFANFAGRTFAGAYTDNIEGLQGLGIRWNGTDGLYSSFAGLGSGEELLISNSLEADKIVALRPIGFDALGILCRKSLWIGYPTGQADRPVDPRIRSNGIGCISEPCATISPAGVTFLSDEGVYNFNQNSQECISESINADLLPIDYTQLARYKMVYMPIREIIFLQTPTCTWIYEFPRAGQGDRPGTPGRWTRRSFSLDNIVIFTDQSGNVYWGTVLGTWADQTLTWAEMIQSQEDAPPVAYFSEGTVLGREDPTSETYLGTAMTSRWETRNALIDDEGKQVVGELTEQVTTMGFEVEYSSTSDSQITFETPDDRGAFTNTFTQALVSTAGARTRALVWNQTTGMGVKMRYKITVGRPKLFSIRQIVQDSGPVIGSAS
jgi:hypothetical protein